MMNGLTQASLCFTIFSPAKRIHKIRHIYVGRRRPHYTVRLITKMRLLYYRCKELRAQSCTGRRPHITHFLKIWLIGDFNYFYLSSKTVSKVKKPDLLIIFWSEYQGNGVKEKKNQEKPYEVSTHLVAWLSLTQKSNFPILATLKEEFLPDRLNPNWNAWSRHYGALALGASLLSIMRLDGLVQTLDRKGF